MEKSIVLTPSQVERFWQKVARGSDEECWLWTGAKLPNGYGHIRAVPRNFYAHRVAYTLMRGQIPDGLHIDHLCRDRACCNPAHLEAVTHAENVRRGLRGRMTPLRDQCAKGHPLFSKGRCLECTRARARAWARKHRHALRCAEASRPLK